ncbi:MAG: hypothetical protein JSR86_08300 [Proteobacteria bacterium]|nr:hypothetical protein [Pseudomonadota bacterium]
MSTRVILAVGALPFGWTGYCWSSDLIAQGYVWDQNEVWGVIECVWIGLPILMFGICKLAYDNWPGRRVS